MRPCGSSAIVQTWRMHVSGPVGSYLGIPRTSHTAMPLRVLHVGGKGFTYMVEYLPLVQGVRPKPVGLLAHAAKN